MKSPFYRYANTILYIKKDTGIVQTDLITGNQLPVIEQIQFLAILKQKTLTYVEQLLAQNPNEVFLEGYLVNPMFFPENIQLPISCNAQVDNVLGTIRIPTIIKSPFNIDRKTGTQIQGYFLRAG